MSSPLDQKDQKRPKTAPKEPSQEPPSSNRFFRFLYLHLHSICILLLAALVGSLAGLLSTLFDLAIDAIMNLREEGITKHTTRTFSTAFWIIGSSSLLSAFGFYLVIRFAPETTGSGIPDIEGALEGTRPLKWWRVIPVKFFAGLSTISAGLVLGREGPSVQMGANAGAMLNSLLTGIFNSKLGAKLSPLFKQRSEDTHLTLVASGAAAGLAAAFNAPLAGMMFVIEEMRPEFKYNLISVKAVMIASIMATVVYRSIQGQGPMIPIPPIEAVPLESLFLFLVFGAIFGVIGVFFNASVLTFMRAFEGFHQHKIGRFIFIGAALGAIFGGMLFYFPSAAGGGSRYIPDIVSGSFSVSFLVMLFLIRAVATVVCFSSGAPGGVFAPMLALGALFGACFGSFCTSLFPELDISVGMFAITGMSALFAATVRAPVTGILLVIELTQEYTLILPLMITTLGAALVAQTLGGRPLYSELLQRLITKQKSTKQKNTSSKT